MCLAQDAHQTVAEMRAFQIDIDGRGLRLLKCWNCRSSAAGGVHSMVGTFKVGEKVVYPAHGVGVIEGVQTKVISGSERKFYMLRIIDSDMTIMIPTENVNSVGLRSEE